MDINDPLELLPHDDPDADRLRSDGVDRRDEARISALVKKAVS